MLLGIIGFAAISLENVSFGHAHLAVLHSFHHHHLYLGSHEHPDAPDAQPGSGRKPSAPQDRSAPQRTVTVSVTPTLFQPVAAGVLDTPLVGSTPLVRAPALPLVVRPALQPTPPRGPPASLIAPGALREKGTP